MRQETVHYFTEKEEEFSDLLIEIGTEKNVAQLLVFLVNAPKATSREIEHGTDLRQPEISIAMKHLVDQGWINVSDIPSENKGRPRNVYSLAVPIEEIFSAIEKEKKAEANHRLELIRKMREYL